MIALALLLAAPASAATVPASPVETAKVDAARLVAARQLLMTLHVDAQLKKVIDQLIPLMATAALGMMESGADSRSVVLALEQKGDGGRDRVLRIIAEEAATSMHAQTENIIAASAAEYAKRFSVSELNELNAFYQSGIGARWLALSPQIQEQVSAIAQKLGMQAGREAGQRAMERAFREMLPQQKTIS